MVKVGQKKRFGVIDVSGEVGDVGEVGGGGSDGGAGSGVGGAGGAGSGAAPAVGVPNETPPEGVAEEAHVQSMSKS